MFKGARTLAELKEYIKDERIISGLDTLDDEEISVVELDRDNFEGEIKIGFAFVHFYTDWCRHCKTLAATWELLAQKYQGEIDFLYFHPKCFTFFKTG